MTFPAIRAVPVPAMRALLLGLCLLSSFTGRPQSVVASDLKVKRTADVSGVYSFRQNGDGIMRSYTAAGVQTATWVASTGEFTGPISGSVADSALSANIPRLNAASNTFTGHIIADRLTVESDAEVSGNLTVNTDIDVTGRVVTGGLGNQGFITDSDFIYLNQDQDTGTGFHGLAVGKSSGGAADRYFVWNDSGAYWASGREGSEGLMPVRTANLSIVQATASADAVFEMDTASGTAGRIVSVGAAGNTYTGTAVSDMAFEVLTDKAFHWGDSSDTNPGMTFQTANNALVLPAGSVVADSIRGVSSLATDSDYVYANSDYSGASAYEGLQVGDTVGPDDHWIVWDNVQALWTIGRSDISYETLQAFSYKALSTSGYGLLVDKVSGTENAYINFDTVSGSAGSAGSVGATNGAFTGASSGDMFIESPAGRNVLLGNSDDTDASFYFDAANNRMGIGRDAAPSDAVDVVGNVRFRTSNSSSGFLIQDRSGTPGKQLSFKSQESVTDFCVFNVMPGGSTSADRDAAQLSLWNVDLDSETVEQNNFDIALDELNVGRIRTRQFGSGPSGTLGSVDIGVGASADKQLRVAQGGNVGLGISPSYRFHAYAGYEGNALAASPATASLAYFHLQYDSGEGEADRTGTDVVIRRELADGDSDGPSWSGTVLDVQNMSVVGPGSDAATVIRATHAGLSLGSTGDYFQCYDNDLGVNLANITAEGKGWFSDLALRDDSGDPVGDNIARVTKLTITESQLSGAGAQTVNLLLPSVPYFVKAVRVKHSATFSGGGVTDLKIKVGYSGDDDKYTGDASFDIDQAAGETVRTDYVATTQLSGNHTAQQIFATLTPAGADMSGLTAGSVDIWIEWLPLQ